MVAGSGSVPVFEGLVSPVWRGDPDLVEVENGDGTFSYFGTPVEGLTASNGVVVKSSQWSKSGGVSARFITTEEAAGDNPSFGIVDVFGPPVGGVVLWRRQEATIGEWTAEGVSNMSIVFGDKASTPAVNAPGETLMRVELDEIAPNGGYITLPGGGNVGDSVWFDVITAADTKDYDGPPSSGSTPNEPGPDGLGWVYSWVGSPNNSVSTRVWDQVLDVAVRVLDDFAAPAVGITVEGLSATESSRVAIYRQTPGKERTLVQGLGNVDVDGAGYWVDYLPPLGVPVTYVVEVLEGDPLEENSATITIPSKTAWLQDALNPLLAVEVACRPGNRDTLFFTAEAFTAFERPTNSDLVQIMGGRVPVGMTSRRQTPVGIPFNMVTTAAEASSMLREVLIEGTHLVLRVPPEISMLDPVTYLSDVQVSEEPGRQSFLGGHVIRWNMTGSQTRGPRIVAWTALWTYDDVAELYAGYSYTDLVDGRRYVQWQAAPDEAQLAGFSTTSGGSNA